MSDDYNPMRGIVYGVLISVLLFWLPLFYILFGRR